MALLVHSLLSSFLPFLGRVSLSSAQRVGSLETRMRSSYQRSDLKEGVAVLSIAVEALIVRRLNRGGKVVALRV
jgi:hypothetical protein